jgi:hypothetical protein
MGKTDGRVTVPVITGLAIGIAFVVAFSLSASSISTELVTEDYNRISLAISGLKSTYEPGEPIIITVTAKGISDNACNRPTPSVVMHDNSNGKTIYWPHPFGFSTAMKCTGPEPINEEWTYRDDVGEEIILDKPGPYTVFASYEGITTEKEFSIQ